MLNRRHLRIKVLQFLYSWNNSSSRDLVKFEKEFLKSLTKIEELYYILYLYVFEIRDYANNHIEDSKHKKLPTKSDLSPNTKFVDNLFLKHLTEETSLMNSISHFKLSFADQQHMIKEIYFEITKLPDYQDYLNSDQITFESDKKFISKLISKHLVNMNLFQDYLNDKEIFWEDDLPFVTSMVVKTIKESSLDETKFLSLFKDDLEKKFAIDLFRFSIVNSERFSDLISEKIKNWELDRVAQMDLILMQMALTEMLEMPTIPLKVTINEYLELAKYYSTQKSKNFVNGILDTLKNELLKEGLIKKSGRGLLE
ncbi:MAG: transcription antitermination factor NusB [Flavobacteriales bacterium]